MFPDVVVQQGGDDEWIGISRQPAVAGEMLVLDVLQSDAVEGEIWRRLPVCVIESRPVIVDGDMRHRIRLHGGITASSGSISGETRMSRMSEFPAILNRELHARVIDVSASGCLVETRRRLEVGTIGRLRVSLSGEECEDDVEVMRCDAIEGPWPRITLACACSGRRRAGRARFGTRLRASSRIWIHRERPA